MATLKQRVRQGNIQKFMEEQKQKDANFARTV